MGGLQKTTLIDFPGRVACTVFTVGCNFRCPFCHNSDLVSKERFEKAGLARFGEEEFFAFLERRKKILDGVCITGGEPTLWPDLPKFCKGIKDKGLEVKLDSNGSNPEMLRRLLKEELVDFVAMDVKARFEEYDRAIGGRRVKVERIKESIKVIWRSGVEYELRTTVVPGIHSKEGLEGLAEEVAELAKEEGYPVEKVVYVLQRFRPKNCLDPRLEKREPFSEKKMEEFLRAVKRVLPQAVLRGE